MLKYFASKERGKNSIVACENDEILSVIYDISPDYEEVQKLANLLNKLEVSIIHFNEVIEDYIQQRAM